MFANLSKRIEAIFALKSQDINALLGSIKSLNPQKKDKNGFAQVIKNDKAIDLKDIKIKDEFFLEKSDIKLKAKALGKTTL